jgi:Tfp pilus assembly protein PilO
MQHDFTFRRQAILAGWVLLVLADVTLAVYSWELASAPQTPQQQFALETRQLDVRKADNKRAEDIRSRIPAIQAKFDQIEKSFPPASSGYSAVRTELGEIGKKSGIQIEDLSLKQVEIANRGMTEVLIDATINGDYKSVIHFLNGVQRSTNYEVDNLTLATDNTNQGAAGVIKVSLHLKTYFRTAG